MRFVWAVAAFVLAALLIGAGIAQRTVFEGPTSQSQAIDVAGDAPYVLLDGGVLASRDGSQTLRVQGDGDIFAAYGRTADLKAWLTKADYTAVNMDGDAVSSQSIAASVPLAEGESAITPQTSDLWLDQFTSEDVLIRPLQLPADMSVLIASDGIQPAPEALTITWPVHSTTPWAGPLIVAGALLLLVGIVLYALGVRHARRSRGPRRKGVPVPVTEPIDISERDDEKGVITASPPRRRLGGGTKALLTVPALGLSALLFTGCTADAWPDFAGTPSPTASTTVVAPDDQETPVVTEAQAGRIVARIADDVAAADEAKDAGAASKRLDGAALAVRETNYRLRAAIPEQKALPAVPTGSLEVTLPEANDEWPRTFFAVAPAEGDGGGSVVMSMTQQDAWAPYKMTYYAAVTSDIDLKLAPTYVGAISIPTDSPFLAIAPEDLAAAYADVLDKGADSEFASLFDADDDAFQTSLADNRASRLASFNETGAQTGSLAFSARPGSPEPIALATLDSGAIVAVAVEDLDTVTPTNTDAVIKVDDNPVVQTLAGVTQSASGFETTYDNQLYFFVPSKSSQERIRLLGFSSDILNAKVVG